MTAFADRNSQEMIAATVAGIWNDKYEGAMEKQSRSFAGKLATLNDNWSMTMQRLGEDFFDFTKVGLTHANLFFDRFNVGLDRGMNPFQAGARALKFTLQDIFGKGPVNKIWSGMEGMFGMLETGGRSLFNVAGGLKNISFGIGAAFLEGDRQQFFRQLPGWLQSSAQYAGTVAEGFGDIYRAFRENGIGGAWDALTGGEGRQIANATVDLVVDAVPRLGNWLWDKGTDLATWLLSKIGMTNTTSTYLGGGMFSESTSIVSLPEAIGVTMDAAARFGEWIWGTVGSASEWISDTIGTVEDVIVDAILKIRPSLAEEDGDNGISVVIGNLLDDLIKAKPIELSPEIKMGIGNIGFSAGEKTGEFLRELDWDTFLKMAPFLNPMSLGGLVSGWATTKIGPAIMQGISRGVSGFAKGLGAGAFGFGEVFAGQWQRDQGMGMDTTTDSWTELIIGWLEDGTAGLTGKLNEWGDGVWTSITDVLSGIWDAATNPFDGLGDKLAGWIDDQFQAAIDKLPGLPGFGAFKTAYNLIPWLDDINLGDDPNDPEQVGVPPLARGGAGGGMRNKLMPMAKSLPMTLDLDVSDAIAKLAALGGSGTPAKGTLGDANAFKAVFDLDTDRAADKKNDAFDWGKTWADETFQSIFAIDNGPAALKYTDAFTWGEAWAGTTFTARFSVDLGPLEAAKIRVAEIAGEISDLLPRSPAKRGPLARPIKFDYIGDALKSAMRGMARDAEVGMSALTGTLAGPVPLAARARPTGGTTINIITIPPDEWLELARAVERGESIDLNLARELAVRKAKAVS
jgi:hypothetical protein